jgi:hypothetical protein
MVQIRSPTTHGTGTGSHIVFEAAIGKPGIRISAVNAATIFSTSARGSESDNVCCAVHIREVKDPAQTVGVYRYAAVVTRLACETNP